MEIGEFPNVRRKRLLVSTESSSAERANTSCRWQEGVTASIGGWQGVNGGLRVDVRCLATHPFSPASPWTAAAPATMPRYQYQPPMLCASTFYQRGSIFLYPGYTYTLLKETRSHSTDPSNTPAVSSIIQARCSTTVPFRRFHPSTCQT